jgi:hypothetical protein
MTSAEKKPDPRHTAQPEPGDTLNQGASALEKARLLFKEMKLPLPPLPKNLLPKLQQTGEHVFATRPALTSLTGLDALVQSAIKEENGNYVAFSYEGHGVHSWHLRYCLDTPNLAVFLEMPYGSPYRDEVMDRAGIRAAYAQINDLSAALVAQFGDTPLDQVPRYLIEVRDWQPSRWGEVIALGYPITWHVTLDPLGELLNTLALPSAAE